MRCAFCKSHVNEKRVTTYYAVVPRRNGARRKVRWCQPCDVSQAEQIDHVLREKNDVPTGAEES